MDWYVVQTISGREPVADINLRRQHFTVFAPKITRTSRHGRNTVKREFSLFPGYLFVGLDLARDRWRSIDGTFGVSRLVKFGDAPAKTPAGLVDRLRQLTEASGIVQFNDTFAVGESVRVIGGTFDSWIGEVVRSPDQHRVVLLLDMMTRKVEVTIPRGRLVRAVAS